MQKKIKHFQLRFFTKEFNTRARAKKCYESIENVELLQYDEKKRNIEDLCKKNIAQEGE